MIETNRFRCLGKQIDDWSATETERVRVDNQVVFRTFKQQQNFETVCFTGRQKIEQCVGRVLSIRAALIETEIEEQVLLRESKVFEQQHVARMNVRWVRQHVVVDFQSDRLDRIGAEVDGRRRTGNLNRDVVDIAEQQFVERLQPRAIAI